MFCVPSNLAIKLEDSISLEIGATIGIPALTAYAGMFKYTNPKNKTILITGALEVSKYAIQMAKHAGATVISSVSGDNKMKAALTAGADHAFRYDTRNFADDIMKITKGEKVDLIFDVALGTNLETNLDIIKDHGIIPHMLLIKKQ